MSSDVTIWHYPRCSKSRKALALLRDQGLDVTVRRYLEDPPETATLEEAIEELGVAARELVRTHEELYSELDIGDREDDMDHGDWIELLAEHPKLLQRPLVFTDTGAVVGRPPERVLKLFSES